MDFPLRDYHQRPSSRRSSPSRAKNYGDDKELMKQGYMNGWHQPSSGRSTPSAAVRRALQALDDSYKHQEDNLPSYRRCQSTTPSKSRRISPIRRFLKESRSPDSQEPATPPRILEIERDNLQDALGDSESRRNVLLRKLAETQRTMEIQNDAVKRGEIEIRESKEAAKLFHQLQDELETKVQFLEQERDCLLNRQLQDTEEKEILRREADNFHHEMKRLKRKLDDAEADNDDRAREANRVREDARNMEESNKRLLENKAMLSEKLVELQELFSASKQRAELLEKEKSHAMDDLSAIQDSQQAIIIRNTELNTRLNTAENHVVQLRNKLDEMEMAYQACKHDKEIYKEKNSKLGYKLTELQTTHKDTQSDLDRSNRYIDELERTLQSVKEMNQKTKESKITLEDNLTTLHADLAKSRLEFSKSSEENTKLKEDIEVARKAQRDFVTTLAEVRHQLSTREEELSQTQASRMSEMQKIGLLQTQKNHGDVEREELAARLTSVQQAHEDMKNRTEEDGRKNTQQLRELAVERDRLNAKYQESELRLERLNLELSATVQHDQSQLDHWRETCTKLTSLIEARDGEQRECVARLMAAEEATERSEVKANALEKELCAMQELRAKLAALTNENNNLAQEVKENQQMISVLEMERDVLSKSPSKSSDNELLSSEVKKLQSELKRALDKLSASESDKTRHARDETQRTKLEVLEADLKRAQEGNRLLDDRLAQVKKEAETLHNLMEARTDAHDREVRKLERERERLESRIRSLEDEARVLRSSLAGSARNPNQYADGELNKLKVEVARLKRDLDEKEQTYLVTKGQLVVAQNARRSADDRLIAFEAQKGSVDKENSLLSNNRPAANPDTSILQVELEAKKARLEATEAECAILRTRIADLTEVKTKSENTIKILRKQIKELKESFRKSDEDSLNSENELSAVIELASVRRDLQRALVDIESRDCQLAELRRNLANAQRQEQKARQERDELKGKTIIMESITDSSAELRKEFENVQKEKRSLEKQLNAYIKSKPSQTPHSSLSLSGDLNKEMEKQYKTVCERNKWLESRISSLIREIELLRDQTSLLTEEKKAAEQQSNVMEGELKSITISSKSSRQQRELEQIHLQNKNAEKIQQVLELQRELREKNQLLQAVSKQLEASQKKSDKSRISSFMKKLRKSSESIGLTSSQERAPLQASSTEPILSTLGSSAGLNVLPSAFSQTHVDPAYDATPFSGKLPREKKKGEPKRPRSTPGDISRSYHASNSVDMEDARPTSRSYQPRDHKSTEFLDAAEEHSLLQARASSARRADHQELLVDLYPDYISDTGEPIRRSPETVATLPELHRKKLTYSSKHEEAAEYTSSDETQSDNVENVAHPFTDYSEQFRSAGSDPDRKRSHSSDGQAKLRERKIPAQRGEAGDELDDSDKDVHAASPTKQSKRSSELMPQGLPPKPTRAPIFSTPVTTPTISPTSARNRSVRIDVTGSGERGEAKESVGPSSGSPLPFPTPTSGAPTKSRSSRVSQPDYM